MAGAGYLHALRLSSQRGECIGRSLATLQIEFAAEHEDGHLDLHRRTGSGSRGILGREVVACIASDHACQQLMCPWILSSEPYQRVRRPATAKRLHTVAASKPAVEFVGDIRGFSDPDRRRSVENET